MSQNGKAREVPEKSDREVKAWYRTLVERIPAVVYVDSSGKTNAAVYVSPQSESMLGFSQEEWLSDPGLWEKILHPADRERALAEATRVREGGLPFKIEYRLVAKDGRAVWVRDEAAPMLGEEGRIQGWRGVMLDITERKQYEEELRKSEERHRLVTKATGEAIWDNDLATGRQQWAGATEALFGYPPHRSETSKWWEERIHPEDKERILSSLKTIYEDGELWTEEYRFRRADGSYATVEDRGYVVRDVGCKPLRMVGSMADVTERRRWEETLKESEERFRTTFEAAAVGMAHSAPDGRWLRVNRKFCQIVGYEQEELLGFTFWDITPPEEMEETHSRVRRMLRGDTDTYSVERRYVRKDGSRVWTKLAISLVRNFLDEPSYFICIAENITTRKLAELFPDPLTPREVEILHRLVEGQTDPQIVRSLSYSLGTVKRDVRRILSKLDAKDRRRAVAIAVESGLVRPSCKNPCRS